MVSGQENRISQRPIYREGQQTDRITTVPEGQCVEPFSERPVRIKLSSSRFLQTDGGGLKCHAVELWLYPVGSRRPVEKLKKGQQNNFRDV